MARTFIEEVLMNLNEKDIDIPKLIFVLPSKRAGYFLKNSLADLTDKTLFSPTIISIEEFIEELSLLKSISNTELLFRLYDIYLEVTPKDQISDFNSFCKWAQIIIQDFNEIDRYLIPQDQIFNYLSAIKEVDHWSVSNEKTDLITNYLSFWNKLPSYYKRFTEDLISKGLGYQGLLYREAVEKIELYIQHNHEKQHVFLGFNALNTAEQKIIQELLHQEMASIYWDIDSHFLNSRHHDAGLFMRDHSQWRFFEKNPFNWMTSHYNTEKNIHCIGIPKNIGQAKYVGELLSNLKASDQVLTNTAVVLGDESLLLPILNSTPNNIGPVNISMGLPLHLAPLASLFDSLFELHKDRKRATFYYKQVQAIISNPFISSILNNVENNNVTQAQQYISINNITHLGLDTIKKLFLNEKEVIGYLFGDWKNDPKIALEMCHSIIMRIKKQLDIDKKKALLPLEYLFKFHQVFNQVSKLLDNYDHVRDIKTLLSLYKEILTNETLDFQGEPLEGVQIIGMLESRVIDFETVIITSVNEGILPSGKSQNSFIPFDVKRDYGLPTYKEKDAVYTYHFYHLLQRAKNVYILYNTEVDALNGGEKSRFISQLEIEGVHDVRHYSVTPEIPSITEAMTRFKKSDAILSRLRDIAAKGFSPSSLTSYIRNPIDFYYQKVLNIDAFDNVEETVASNTLGTIIHNTLEDLYTPFIDKHLTIDGMLKMKLEISKVVERHFKKEFKDGDTTRGKNLLVYEITKRYVSNFIDLEVMYLKQGQKIKIVALEKELNVEVAIPELDFPVRLKGTVDRIDECDGVLRVIDYKTGKVEQNKVEIVAWEDITTDYTKFSKSFQILSYAYMLHLDKPQEKSVEAGIVSFKNLKQGLLKFAKKDSARSQKKDHSISEDTLNQFSMELKKLICEICNSEFDFVEKEI